MATTVDAFFTSGCGRCPKFDTPDCKVHKWQPELAKLRAIILDCGLTEVLKWGHPVYMFENSNMVMLGAFNYNCALSFFKGALLHFSAPKQSRTREARIEKCLPLIFRGKGLHE